MNFPKPLTPVTAENAHLFAQSRNLEGGGNGPYDPTMEARVAVLEQIAKDTKEVLVEMRGDIKGIRNDLRSDFRWLLGLGIGATAFLILGGLSILALMAHGFGWL